MSRNKNASKQYQEVNSSKEKEEKENKLKKYSWFELILYPQDNETNHNADLLNFIVKNKYLYPRKIYITHDRDVDENGEIKKSHVHLILKCAEKYTITGIMKQFIYLNLNQVIGIEHIKQAFMYLTHETFEAQQANKVQYSKEDLQGDTDLIQEIIQNRNYAQQILMELIEEQPYTIDVYKNFQYYSSNTQIALKAEFESRPAFYQKMCTEEQNKRKYGNKVYPVGYFKKYIEENVAEYIFEKIKERESM